MFGLNESDFTFVEQHLVQIGQIDRPTENSSQTPTAIRFVPADNREVEHRSRHPRQGSSAPEEARMEPKLRDLYRKRSMPTLEKSANTLLGGTPVERRGRHLRQGQSSRGEY